MNVSGGEKVNPNDTVRKGWATPMKRILGILTALAAIFLASGANASWLGK